MSVAELADELYALPADEFTRARDAAAKDAADTEEKKTLKALKRPSASAWLVNQLARQRADRLEELLALGDQLRTAQDALSGDDLRRLNRERHQLVHAVAEQCRALTDKVTDQVLREVEATLDAALADPAAGDAVRTGRLVRALASAGFEGVDLSGAVALPELAPAPRAKKSTSRPKAPPAPTKKSAPKQSAADNARERRELAKAKADAARAEKDLARHDADLAAARDRVDTSRAELERLDAELKDARTERSSAEKELERAQRARNATARDHRAAQQRLEKLTN